jgi:hypothetical protein
MSQQLDLVLTRGHDGKQPLRATTEVELGIERRRLMIETRKGTHGLHSRAWVVQWSECGRHFTHVMGIGGEGDFARTLAHQPGARGTETAIRAMHAQSLAQLDTLRAQALAHYAPKPELSAIA